MASRSNVQIHVGTMGDIVLDEVVNCAQNAAATCEVNIMTLQTGPNPFERPIVPGYIVTGLLIMPPPDNIAPLSIKGNDLDVGIHLHPTNPTFISLNPDQIHGFNIDLSSGTPVIVKLIWT